MTGLVSIQPQAGKSGPAGPATFPECVWAVTLAAQDQALWPESPGLAELPASCMQEPIPRFSCPPFTVGASTQPGSSRSPAEGHLTHLLCPACSLALIWGAGPSEGHMAIFT